MIYNIYIETYFAGGDLIMCDVNKYSKIYDDIESMENLKDVRRT